MNEVYFSLSIEQFGLFALFVLIFIIQASYYLNIFGRVAFFRHKGANMANVSQEGVSVIICARNEIVNLQKNLPLILEQGHPEFEVVVVNIESTDGSEDVLTLLSQKYPNLVIRTIAQSDRVFGNTKAIAWGVGIKAAKYEWIVLTDANCFPDDGNWLASIQKNFTGKTEVILSYTHRECGQVSRAEHFFRSLFYLGKGLAHKPYTGCGENLIFRKSLFFDKKGFHHQLKSRDRVDRVFVNTIANKNNTVVDITPSTINSSDLKLSFGDWQQKKINEIRSNRLFKSGARISEYFELASRILFYILFPITLYFVLNIQWAWITVVSIFTTRLLLQIFIFAKAQKRLKERGILIASLWWDVVSPILYLPIFMAAKFGKR